MHSCRRQVLRQFYREITELSSNLGRGFLRPAQPTMWTSIDVNMSSSKLRNSRAEVMTRRVNVPGGLKAMRITSRPTDRSAVHGVRMPPLRGEDSVAKMKEWQQDEFLEEARKKQAAKIIETEKAVRTEHAVRGGNGESSLDVDEEVRRGLVADSEHPIGRVVRADEGKDYVPKIGKLNAEAQKYDLEALPQSPDDLRSTDRTRDKE